MKKLLFVMGALLLALGTWAEDAGGDAASLQLFDRFVAELKKSAPEDAEVRGDREYRIVFLDLRMPVASTAPFDISAAKEGVAMYLKDSAELFQTLKITLLVNFVTTDRRIRTVIVTPQDLKAAAAAETE